MSDLIAADLAAILRQTQRGSRLEDKAASFPDLRALHRFCFCIDLFTRKANRKWRDANRKTFLLELRSDAIHMLYVLIAGDVRGAKFYLRSCVENLWRHTYFREHPVESRWLQTRPSFFLTIEDLRQYCSKRSESPAAASRCQKRLADGYAELCRLVHSTAITTMTLDASFTDIRAGILETRSLARDVRAIGRDLILSLCLAEPDLMTTLDPTHRLVLTSFLDKQRRRELANLV